MCISPWSGESWRRRCCGLRRAGLWWLGVLLVLRVGAGPASAQTTCTGSTGPCAVQVNQPFAAEIDPPSQPPVVVGYRVYLDGVKIGADIPAPLSTAPVTVPGLTVTIPGNHTLEASAFNSDGEGPKIPLALIATATADTVPPLPPTHLIAVPTTTQVTLGWEAGSDNVGVVGYRVARGALALGIVTSLTFMEAGLTPNTSYTYTVTALDGAGNVSPPASVTVQTLSIPAACSAGGKPYSITIAVQSYSQKLAIGARGAVSLTLANSFPVTRIQVTLGPQVVGEITGAELRDITGIGFSVPRTPATYQLFISATDALGCVTRTTAARSLVVQ